jgi:hypothetical protein
LVTLLALAQTLTCSGCAQSDVLDPRTPPNPLLNTEDGEHITAGSCEPDGGCHQGFHCEQSFCVLNGDQGDLQVTLEWQNDPRTPADLDLHLLEPNAASGCEIWYGDPNRNLHNSSCGAMGSLDLDANGACVVTDLSGGPASDTENIIYPPHTTPPSGHYVVRVDLWDACGIRSEIPYTVIVRNYDQVTRFNNVFKPSDADNGDVGSGVVITEFDVR